MARDDDSTDRARRAWWRLLEDLREHYEVSPETLELLVAVQDALPFLGEEQPEPPEPRRPTRDQRGQRNDDPARPPSGHVMVGGILVRETPDGNKAREERWAKRLEEHAHKSRAMSAFERALVEELESDAYAREERRLRAAIVDQDSLQRERRVRMAKLEVSRRARRGDLDPKLAAQARRHAEDGHLHPEDLGADAWLQARAMKAAIPRRGQSSPAWRTEWEQSGEHTPELTDAEILDRVRARMRAYGDDRDPALTVTEVAELRGQVGINAGGRPKGGTSKRLAAKVVETFIKRRK